MRFPGKFYCYSIYAVVCLVTILFFYLFFIGYKTGQGKHVVSPDGKYNAYVMLYEKHRMLRINRFYTVTWIENNEKKILWSATFKDRYSYFYWYEHGNIEWIKDSKKVVFIYTNPNNPKEILFKLTSPSLNELLSPY